MPEGYESAEFDVFKKAILNMNDTHVECSIHDCRVCGLIAEDVRELWDAIYAAGLVVSAGVRLQDIPALTKDQAFELVHLWRKKYNYIAGYYQERFIDG